MSERPLNPWHPMTDEIDLAILGKLAEELSECGAAVARCIIQGVDGSEPVTGKPNKEWLEDEIADVLAGIHLSTRRFGLDGHRILEREGEKIGHLNRWHSLLLKDAPADQRKEAMEVVRDLLPYACASIGLPRESWPSDSVILRAEKFIESLGAK